MKVKVSATIHTRIIRNLVNGNIDTELNRLADITKFEWYNRYGLVLHDINHDVG